MCIYIAYFSLEEDSALIVQSKGAFNEIVVFVPRPPFHYGGGSGAFMSLLSSIVVVVQFKTRHVQFSLTVLHTNWAEAERKNNRWHFGMHAKP